MNDTQLRNYAAILVDTCLGFGEGGKLRIRGEPPHRELMLAAARRAYERGAREVRFEWADSRLHRIAAESRREEYLDQEPTMLARLAAGYAEERWATLSFAGDEDPSLLEGADPVRLQRLDRAAAKAATPFREAVLSNRFAWTAAPGPTEGWARKVFSLAGRDPGPEPAKALWDILVPILRLDQADPARAVAAHMEGLEARGAALDRLALREVRFRGPGTDLRVSLSERSRWRGGVSSTQEGRRFYPNLPSEEVFTSPDWRGVQGRAAATRPFDLYGLLVEGAWFEFEKGSVRAFGADKNEEALGRFLDTDAGARRLGELALVDARGPIFQSGLIFANTLIDENAACHIALGAAYDDAFEGAGALSPEERAALGFNESLVHEDIMIGSEEVEVFGLDAAGREHPLITGGKFRIA